MYLRVVTSHSNKFLMIPVELTGRHDRAGRNDRHVVLVSVEVVLPGGQKVCVSPDDLCGDTGELIEDWRIVRAVLTAEYNNCLVYESYPGPDGQTYYRIR